MTVAQHPEHFSELFINCNLTSSFLPPLSPPTVGKQARPGAVLKYRQGMFGAEGTGFTKSKLKFISTDAVNVRPLESFKPSFVRALPQLPQSNT